MPAKRLLHGTNHLPFTEARRSSRISRGGGGPFPSFSVGRPATAATRRTQAIQVAGAVSSEADKKKVANLCARRRQRIGVPDYAKGDGGSCQIGEFLRHPSGVESMLNIRALQSFERLEPDKYRCILPAIQFLKFEVVPVMDLRMIPTNEGCIVEMLSCEFKGSETVEEQNRRFSASMTNHITWEVDRPDPYLDFDVTLSISLEVYTVPFIFLPTSAVETPGNLVMQGLIDRLVPLLIHQLLEDYRIWIEERLRVSQ